MAAGAGHTPPERERSNSERAPGEQSIMSKQIPGSMPRACDATYRGYLTSEAPKRIALEDGREMVKARMGANMAASTVSSEEDRNECVEWLNVIAMSPAQMERLERCQPRELLCVSGPVTLRPYKTRGGDSRLDRTVIAEYVRSASASMPAKPKEDVSSVDDELPASEPPPAEGDTGAAAPAAG